MLEESLPSILASVYGWFTPTVLFLLLNLVIGTIAVTSKGGLRSSSSSTDAPAFDRPVGGLARVPSLALDRLRSFNLYRFRSGEIPFAETLIHAPLPQPRETLDSSLIPDPVTVPLELPKPAAEDESQDHQPHHQHIIRSQSDAQPTAGEKPVKLSSKIKKSASDKSAFAHFEEEEEVEVEAEVVGGGEVDARADDFINRFRNQLRLQRLDSIMRYKEMLGRKAGQ